MSANAKRILIWLVFGGLLIVTLAFLLWPKTLAVDLATVTVGSLIVTTTKKEKHTLLYPSDSVRENSRITQRKTT
jgi:hypothetical protein